MGGENRFTRADPEYQKGGGVRAREWEAGGGGVVPNYCLLLNHGTFQ